MPGGRRGSGETRMELSAGNMATAVGVAARSFGIHIPGLLNRSQYLCAAAAAVLVNQ